MKPNQSQNRITARELFPSLSESQLKEAEENLYRYVAVGLQIYQDNRSVPDALDGSQSSYKIKERSNSNSYENG